MAHRVLAPAGRAEKALQLYGDTRGTAKTLAEMSTAELKALADDINALMDATAEAL